MADTYLGRGVATGHPAANRDHNASMRAQLARERSERNRQMEGRRAMPKQRELMGRTITAKRRVAILPPDAATPDDKLDDSPLNDPTELSHIALPPNGGSSRQPLHVRNGSLNASPLNGSLSHQQYVSNTNLETLPSGSTTGLPSQQVHNPHVSVTSRQFTSRRPAPYISK